MRWQKLFLIGMATAAQAIRSPLRAMDTAMMMQRRADSHLGVAPDQEPHRGPVAHKFLNNKTKEYLVNGTGIPDVDFDIGEAYSGLMSISANLSGPDKFFFWFQPSTNPAADKEILIWLNGGPGCSSLEGLLQENGPFSWQYGTFKPVKNSWSWHLLTNVLWVEQPIGTGFSTGNITARDEEDVARQFMAFFKNFVNTFSMQGYKVYISGESYAGMYCPYLASAMLDANDTSYFNVKGMLLYDPEIADDRLREMSIVPFVDHNRNLFPLNDTYLQAIHDTDRKCGYADFRSKYPTYPARDLLPNPLPGVDAKTGNPIPGCEDLKLTVGVEEAATQVNPCFDRYQVATTCPLLWDVLGFPGDFDYVPQGASIYFDRKDVKKAIHAPLDRKWTSCSSEDVFVDGNDMSPWSSTTVLGGVIDRTRNVIIGQGSLDYRIISNAVLLAIQNTTFGGKLGFERAPTEPFYVPYHHRGSDGSVAGAGILGTAHTERGLTYVDVALSGHMLPQYAPSAAFRHLEVLLGRVDSLSSKKPFTTDPGVPQPAS